jgi:zinc protease
MKMKTFLLLFIILSGALRTSAQNIPAYKASDIDIPYQKFVLDNGLTLVVHEDHKAPIVAVNTWYHVGSKNEKEGKSGFAHLFEHLMFNGSEHFNDDYFQALERIGGTDLNGTTNEDRTNYFQNVPIASLDQVLWLESDRMGHLLGAIDQAKLDEQRGVVQNEKRQGENQPYSKEWDMINKMLFPKGHPYSWTVIGEMEDLNAASLDDVHEWFKRYYGPANTVIVIAGDITPEVALAKVKDYFGNIPSGPTLQRWEANVPVKTGEFRATYQDRVPEAKVSHYWVTPQWGTADAAYLDLAGMILSSGKNSRLFKKLVYEDQTASNVYAYNYAQEIAGAFGIGVYVKKGQSMEAVEKTLNGIVADFLKNGPTDQEMQRAKATMFTGFIKGLERIGGFGGKSDVLAESMVYGGSPDAYKEYLDIFSKATKEDVLKAARKWLSDGKHVITCTPFPEYSVSGKDVDRSKLPEVGPAQASKFPDLQKTTLKNGMKVVLAQRKDVPTVIMNMMFDAGYSSDSPEKAGMASLSMNLLDEGTKTRNSLEINELSQMLGASIGAYSDLDVSYVRMSTLKPSLDASLDLYADVILNPSFPQKEFDRLQSELISDIQGEKAQPFGIATRVFPKLLYGDGHPYALPMSGNGFEETVKNLKRDDALSFYNNYIRPNNATIVVVGDIEMKDLVSKLESRFGSWEKGTVPKKNIAAAPVAKGKKLFLMDRPESEQSIIIAGHLTEAYGKVSEPAKEAALNVLGGEFTSRLNMNLREDKHWSYGAGVFVMDTRAQRPLLAYAPVQTDKTSESVTEVINEITQFTGDKPITQQEFEKTVGNTILSLPGKWETNGSVSGSLVESVKYNLSDDYWKTFDQKMRSLKVDDARKAAMQLVKPGELTYFVVGDKEKVLPNLQKLGFDEIIFIDADGKVTGKAAKKAAP